MSEPRDDRELEEYLRGGSPLSRRYREASGEEPAPAVDDAILAASRRAVQSRPGLVPRSWFRPLSIAAIVVLSATIVLTMQRGVETVHRDMSGTEQESAGRAASMEAEPGQTDADMEALHRSEPLRLRKAEAPLETSRVDAAEIPAAPAVPAPVPTSPAESGIDVPAAEPPAAMERPRTPLAIRRAAEMPMPEKESPPREVQMREAPAADLGYAPAFSPARVAPEERLAEITRLWNEGNRDAALQALREFLAQHPRYGDEDLRRLLPPALYAEVRPPPNP